MSPTCCQKGRRRRKSDDEAAGLADRCCVRVCDGGGRMRRKQFAKNEYDRVGGTERRRDFREWRSGWRLRQRTVCQRHGLRSWNLDVPDDSECVGGYRLVGTSTALVRYDCLAAAAERNERAGGGMSSFP